MPPHRRKAVIDDVVDSAVDALFDRGAELIDRMRQPAVVAVPPPAPGVEKSAVRMCAACRKKFRTDAMEMINPRNTFGLCPECFGFLWEAGKRILTAQRAQQRVNAPVAAPPPKPRKPPWEVLGIDPDASADEVKKAYRKLAAQYHPDTVPPGSPSEEKQRVTELFMEVQRAFDVMMKVRKAPT